MLLFLILAIVPLRVASSGFGPFHFTSLNAARVKFRQCPLFCSPNLQLLSSGGGGGAKNYFRILPWYQSVVRKHQAHPSLNWYSFTFIDEQNMGQTELIF